MPVIALIVVGLAAGFLATWLVRIDNDRLMWFGAGALVLCAALILAGWSAGLACVLFGAMGFVWLRKCVTAR